MARTGSSGGGSGGGGAGLKAVPKGADRLLSPAAFEKHYSGSEEERVAGWLADLTGAPVPTPLQGGLRSGEVLCRAVNALRQGKAIPRISKLNLPFPQRENIAAFCAAARELGVPDQDNFTTDDLYDNKDMPQVVRCLLALGRQAYFIPDWNGPCLGKPEKGPQRVWKRH